MKIQMLMRGGRLRSVLLCFTVSVIYYSLLILPAYSQEDIMKFVEKKRIEIKEKEETLKKEEERLNFLKKDVDERIQQYTQLLDKLENVLKKIEQVKNDKLDHIVKSYEAMPAEKAASRLSVLDENMAAHIMLRMKSKKVGAIIAIIEPKKAAVITRKIASLKVEGQ